MEITSEFVRRWGESGLSQDKGYNLLVGKKLYFVELLAFEEVCCSYRVIVREICQLVDHVSKSRACYMIMLTFVIYVSKAESWSWHKSNSCIIMQSSLVHLPRGGVRGSTADSKALRIFRAIRLDLLAVAGLLFFESNTWPQAHTAFLTLTLAEQCTQTFVRGISRKIHERSNSPNFPQNQSRKMDETTWAGFHACATLTIDLSWLI